MVQISKRLLRLACLLLGWTGFLVKAQQDPGEPLFLSPLIEAGESIQAREAAMVTAFLPVKGYSGYITVNKEHNSNIFFWYFPAEETPDDAPVILWSDGGPGISAFFSIYAQNGPFTGIGAGDNYTLNPFSWHKKFHMIFMDNPVEVGYSFTDNENGFITSASEAAEGIYEFMAQFFTMFPNLQKNKFYNGGASFGASYAIETANLIHKKNSENPSIRMNLAGLILDSPWIECYSQADYGDVLFHAGLINQNSLDHFKEKEQELRDLIKQEKYLDGFSAWAQLTQMDAFKLTGYPAINNICEDNPKFVDMTNFVTSNSTRKAIHVGSRKFSFINSEQQGRMHATMLHSAKSKMDELLIAGYRVLIYVGNMDGSTGHVGIRKISLSLTWESGNDIVDGPRTIWKDDKGVAGYVTEAGKTTTFVLLRNAGHGCLTDQPERVLAAVDKFLGEESAKKSASY